MNHLMINRLMVKGWFDMIRFDEWVWYPITPFPAGSTCYSSDRWTARILCPALGHKSHRRAVEGIVGRGGFDFLLVKLFLVAFHCALILIYHSSRLQKASCDIEIVNLRLRNSLRRWTQLIQLVLRARPPKGPEGMWLHFCDHGWCSLTELLYCNID